jgi:hypothetical protein
MYVLRQSPNIAGDVARGWSAWMGLRAGSLAELVDITPDIDAYELADAWERWQDEEWHVWHHRDHADYDAFLRDYLDERNLTATQDMHAPADAQWCWWHHDGLACYRLDAETDADAISEGKATAEAMGIATGQGYMTVGSVKVVAALADGWYVLECEDVAPES